MFRKLLGLLTGLISAVVVVMFVENLGHRFYPPVAETNLHPNMLESYMNTLPTGAFLFVLGAWCLGAFTGGWVAGMITKTRPLLYSSIITALILAASIFNLIAIPHPLWFTISAVTLVPLMAPAATVIIKKSSSKKTAQPIPE